MTRRAAGQATVELLVFLPFVLMAAFAGATIVGVESTRERANEAARAGAMAVLQGDDPLRAARDVLHKGERNRVRVRARRVTVDLPPPLPVRVLLPRLRAKATADAGPEAIP